MAICQLRAQDQHTAIQFGLFVVPTIVATIFSIYKINRLIHKVDDVAGPSQAASHVINSESMMRKQAAKRGIR